MKNERVYLGSIYQNKSGDHTWLAGNLGAARISIWPSKTKEGQYNIYLENKQDKPDRRETTTQSPESVDKIPF